jgi:O-antigen ligase
MFIAAALLLVPVLISGFWTEDKTTWWNSLSVKIPFLTMMLGLSATTLSKKCWLQIAWTYIIVIVIGCAWSLQQYLADPGLVQESYLKAKVLPTPADSDYVRFSWMAALAVFIGIKSLLMQNSKKANIILSALLIFLIGYLHLLASKTGLLCLYSGSILYFLHLLFIQKNGRPH